MRLSGFAPYSAESTTRRLGGYVVIATVSVGDELGWRRGRQVQNLDALFAERAYSAAPGWAGVKATHTGPYLEIEPTGNAIDFNGLDWWKREGDQYVENWVFVDMIHLFNQFGVDLLARIPR